MDWTEFAQWGRHVSDWAQDYHLGVRDRPVRARTKPGEIFAQLPETPPEALPLNALHAGDRLVSRRLEVFLDWAKACLAEAGAGPGA